MELNYHCRAQLSFDSETDNADGVQVFDMQCAKEENLYSRSFLRETPWSLYTLLYECCKYLHYLTASHM